MPTPVLLPADRLFAQILHTSTPTPYSGTSSSSSSTHPGASRAAAASVSANAYDNTTADINTSIEREDDNEEVVQVVAGWGHSALVTASGRVYTAGRNMQGQLGLGPVDGFPMNERGSRG